MQNANSRIFMEVHPTVQLREKQLTNLISFSLQRAIDVVSGNHPIVPVPWTPKDVKGLWMIEWACTFAAARMLEDLMRGNPPMLSVSHHPAPLSPFPCISQSHPAQVSRACGRGIGNGVIPLLPPGVLLLQAASCFAHALLIWCVCAVRAGTEWQQNYGYRSNSIKTTPLAAHIHPVEFNIALRLAISFSPVVCFWI